MEIMTYPVSKDQQQLKQLAGLAFFGMALCYITLFIIYGAVLSPPANPSTAETIAYLIENKSLLNFSYVLGYVLFAMLLCFCVYLVGSFYRTESKITIVLATLFGYFWVVVLLCAGMIGITSHELLASYSTSDPAAAEVIYHARTLLTESLGGGIEFIGGVWLVGLGIVSWRHHQLSRALSAFTLVKGLIGVATLFSTASVLRDLFGITGIVWFIWMGLVMLKKPS